MSLISRKFSRYSLHTKFDFANRSISTYVYVDVHKNYEITFQSQSAYGITKIYFFFTIL